MGKMEGGAGEGGPCHEYEDIDYEDRTENSGQGEGDYEVVEVKQIPKKKEEPDLSWRGKLARLFNWMPKSWRHEKQDDETEAKKVTAVEKINNVKHRVKNDDDGSNKENHVEKNDDKRQRERHTLDNGSKVGDPSEKKRKDSTDSEEIKQESLESPQPLTIHQTRVVTSLQKLEVPAWFKDARRPTRHRRGGEREVRRIKEEKSWKKDKDAVDDPLDIISPRWSTARETSTCRSFSSAYSRWSGSRYREGSAQSWHPLSKTYRKPYLGWRNQNTTPGGSEYLMPPTERLANSKGPESWSARNSPSQANSPS